MSNITPQGDPPVNRILLTVIRLLVAVGVPVGTGWAFAQTVTKNLWLAVGLTLLYEIVLLIVGFFGKVWQGLEGPVVNRAIDQAKFILRTIFFRYRKHYYQHLIYEHQVFDVRGLTTRTAHSLELEHVFVQLDMAPTPAQQASTSLLKVPQQLSQGEHDIWDYLSSAPLAKQHFVIVGPPGSGKTTLLKHIVLTLAQPKRVRRSRSRVARKLPILLYLRDHVETIKATPDCTLIDLVENHLQKKWQETIPARWLADYLRRGQCLIMLDGLDEVADAATRKQVVAWVQSQMLAYLNNRFILTSRPYGYNENPLDGVTVLEVRPFTLKQVKQFIQQWYLATEHKSWGKDDPGMRMRAREGAEELIHKLYQTPALLDLAVNPLLLTMIATIHYVRQALPGKRVELYREICDVLLGKRRGDIGIAQALSAAQMQVVLQPLAYYLMQQKTLEIKTDRACRVIKPYLARVSTTMQPETFLRTVENSSGLLLEQNPGIYSFVHKTFQEYLSAAHIKDKKLEKELINHVGDNWWHETIRLYCAQNDATNIIEACLSQASMSVEVLTLAIECNEEKQEAQPFVEVQVKELLDKGVEDPDPERRRVIAEALLNRRLQQMVYLHDEVYVDTSLVTCAEYQLFLDYPFTPPLIQHYYYPLHWQSNAFLPGQGHEPILGVQPRDAQDFCEWLNEQDAGVWYYRLPSQDESEQIRTLSRKSGKLKADTGYWLNNGKGLAWAGGNAPEYNGLDQMIQSVLDNDLKQAATFSRIHSALQNQTIDQALKLEQELDQKHVPAFSLQFANDLYYARALNFVQLYDLSQIVANAKTEQSLIRKPEERALITALPKVVIPGAHRWSDTEESRGGTESLDESESTLLQRWYIRYISQLLARIMDYYAKQPVTKRVEPRVELHFVSHTYTSFDYSHNRYREIYTDIYISFAILELRIQGKLPAWEGILLVKERRRE